MVRGYHLLLFLSWPLLSANHDERVFQGNTTAHDVFISYSTTDKIIADTLVSALENNNVRCWYAPRDILAGKPGGS